MIEQVHGLILRLGLIAPGDRVLVAVSGGADSVALLHLLWRLREPLGIALHAAHLDHGLRPESREEARFVRHLCEGLSVALREERVPVGEQVATGRGGLEQVARDIRHRFLRQAAQRAGCNLIALGHHRGDQAETLLLRLLRGTGPAGLAAMRYRSGMLVRPLLELSRAEILAYLQAQELSWVEDPSNRDERFTRNRIRNEVLPLLQTFNPRIEEGLARLAQRMAREEDGWNQHLSVPPLVDGEIDWPLNDIRQLHPGLRDRCLRRAVQRVRGDLRGLEQKHIEAIGRLLVTNPGGLKELHLPGMWVAVDGRRLRLRKAPPPAAAPFDMEISAPGEYVLPDGSVLRVALTDKSRGESRWAAEFCAAAASFPLRIRSWRPGDRIRPVGMQGRKKIKDVFLDARLPREQRAGIPLLIGAGQVLWVVGLRRCAGLRPAPGHSKILRVVLDGAKIETLRL